MFAAPNDDRLVVDDQLRCHVVTFRRESRRFAIGPGHHPAFGRIDICNAYARAAAVNCGILRMCGEMESCAIPSCFAECDSGEVDSAHSRFIELSKVGLVEDAPPCTFRADPTCH